MKVRHFIADPEMPMEHLKELISSRFLFHAALLTVLYIVQRFWFVRAWRLTGLLRRPAWKVVLRCLVAAAGVALLASLPGFPFGHFRMHMGAAHRLLSAAGRVWMTASFLAFVALMVVTLAERLSRLALFAVPSDRRERFDPGRRKLLRYAALVVGSIPFAATAYGFSLERFQYHIRKVDVPISGLPEGLDGLRIAQLSDVHIGAFMPRSEVRRAVDMANGLHADMAVVTGDFITEAGDPLEECISELSRLRAPLGVWGCNGNHEIYARVQGLAQRLFKQHGMRLLRQESAEIDWRGGKFNLIGVDYQRGHRLYGKESRMLEEIVPLIRSDIPNILLSHNPNSFYRAAELGIQLSLAGHTHGGQVCIDIVDHDLTPARFFTKFIAGTYRLPSGVDAGSLHGAIAPGPEPATLYVNRGLGTIAMPVRLGAPPEITLLTLRRA